MSGIIHAYVKRDRIYVKALASVEISMNLMSIDPLVICGVTGEWFVDVVVKMHERECDKCATLNTPMDMRWWQISCVPVHNCGSQCILNTFET